MRELRLHRDKLGVIFKAEVTDFEGNNPALVDGITKFETVYDAKAGRWHVVLTINAEPVFVEQEPSAVADT